MTPRYCNARLALEATALTACAVRIDADTGDDDDDDDSDDDACLSRAKVGRVSGGVSMC